MAKRKYVRRNPTPKQRIAELEKSLKKRNFDYIDVVKVNNELNAKLKAGLNAKMRADLCIRRIRDMLMFVKFEHMSLRDMKVLQALVNSGMARVEISPIGFNVADKADKKVFEFNETEGKWTHVQVANGDKITKS